MGIEAINRLLDAFFGNGDKTASQTKINRLCVGTFWSIFFGLFVAHMVSISVLLIDFPSIDEFNLMAPEKEMFTALHNHDWGTFLDRLYQTYNEHRIIFPKLQFAVFYYLNHFNTTSIRVLNLFLWVINALVILKISTVVLPGANRLLVAPFLLFFLSPAWVSHHAPPMSMTHDYAFFFLFVSVSCLFHEEQRKRNLFMGVVGEIGCIYSSATGLAFFASSLSSWGIYKVTRVLRAEGEQRRTEAAQLATVTIICLIGLYTWFMGPVFTDVTGSRANPPANLFGYYFYEFIFVFLASGFGFEQYQFAAGVLVFIFIITPDIVLVYRKKLNLPGSAWMLITIKLCLLAGLVLSAYGRSAFEHGGMVRHENFLNNRGVHFAYAYAGLFLIPFSIMSWWSVLHRSCGVAKFFTSVVWLVLFTTYLNNWNFPRPYQHYFYGQIFEQSLLIKYYLGIPADSPDPNFGSKAELARSHKLSYAVEALRIAELIRNTDNNPKRQQ